MTAIQESKDLKQMKVEELIGNLTAYELEMKFKEEREGGDTRKKSIALKGTTESDGDDDDDAAAELELLIKKFKMESQVRKSSSKSKIEKQNSQSTRLLKRTEDHLSLVQPTLIHQAQLTSKSTRL